MHRLAIKFQRILLKLAFGNLGF